MIFYFSFSSRNTRSKKEILILVSKHKKNFLGLVSKPEIKCQKFSVSSRCARLNQRNSHSRLENEKVTLADLCHTVIKMFKTGCWKRKRLWVGRCLPVSGFPCATPNVIGIKKVQEVVL